jgi:Peptidase inhibitor I78 family
MLRALGPVPLALAALALASCAPQPADNTASGQQSAAATAPADEPVRTDPPAAPATSEESAMCDAAKAQFAVGQTYSDTLAAEAKAAAGAKVVRQLLPGQAVTMEFRGDRLNLETGEGGRVVSVRCG